jgi:hypothetical protein
MRGADSATVFAIFWACFDGTEQSDDASRSGGPRRLIAFLPARSARHELSATFWRLTSRQRAVSR